jgi:hypothetical protein
MLLTNQQIYNYALALSTAFSSEQRLPMKINFYLQKNKNTLLALGQDIENSRLEVIRAYGTPNEDGTQYTIPKESIEIAQKELNDLFALEQEVCIYKISADSLPDDISLTTSQMEAIMFMID